MGTPFGNGLPIGEFLEHPGQHRFDGVKYVVLSDESHFKIELIKFAGRAVGAGVFVAESTARSENTYQTPATMISCLKLLRRLRQGVKLPRVLARRHQIVARAFRR